MDRVRQKNEYKKIKEQRKIKINRFDEFQVARPRYAKGAMGIQAAVIKKA